MNINVNAQWPVNYCKAEWGTVPNEDYLHDNQNNKTGLMAELTRLDNSFKNRARALDRVLWITREIQASLDELVK